jgi:oligosaccharyltransferase complex subunit delta (ribophorin II)
VLTVQTPAKIPTALLASKSPLAASIVIGSFGASKPLKSKVFEFSAPADSSASASASQRYGAKPEIHHIFRGDPRSPPKVLTLAFTLAVLACLPGLLIAWVGIGANLSHLPKALGAAPVSHVLFFGSIVGMEFVFFKYYTEWRLFTLLPVAGVVGLVAFLSGSGALTEVQERRLKGER